MMGMGMGLPPAKAKDFRGSLRRLFGTLRPERTLLVVVVLLGIVSVAFNVIGPKILGEAINRIVEGALGKQILGSGATQQQAIDAARAQGQDQLADMLSRIQLNAAGIDFGALGGLLGVLVAVYVISSIFGWMQGWIMAGVTQRTVVKLRADVDHKLGRLPLRYFDSHPRGDLLSRVTNDIDNIGQSLQQTLTQLITSLLTIVGVLILMITISPILAVISLLAVPASLAVTILIVRRSQQQFVAQWASTGALNGHVEEMHTGHAIVKAFGRQREAIEVFDAENERLYDATRRAQFISGIIQPALTFISNLNYVAIAVIGGLRVAAGQLSIGDVVAFIQYSRQFTFPIIQTASIVNVLQSAVASAERVFELLDEPEEIADPAVPADLDRVRGAVAFEDVSFRYEPERPLIEHLDLTVEAGQTVEIVGPTGAGKTTLVNLVMRFYDLDGGRITVDGHDIAALPRHELRSRIGMVLQDTWLFEGTIRDNIAYGRPGATDDEIRAAARAARADEFIERLPKAYDTGVEERGVSLSGGQKQRIAIARALVRRPHVYIFDDSFSALDFKTDAALRAALRRETAHSTVLVVAQRVSTVLNVDRIVVLDEGRVVGTGTHRELMKTSQVYREIVASQLSEEELAA